MADQTAFKFLTTLDQKSPAPSVEENKTKLMYSCARRTNHRVGGTFQDLIGLLLVGAICFYVIFKFATSGVRVGLSGFTKDHEIAKLLIGLMLLNNVRNLSNSLVNNLILPLVEPMLPFLLCKLNIYYGPFQLEFGEFISDLIVFTINLFIIYVVFVVLS